MRCPCRTLDNGLGRRLVRAGECEGLTEYDRRLFRHVPPVEAAVWLFWRYFFSRTDLVCHFARWDAPCPAVGGDDLDAMLRAHVGGPREKAATIRWRSKKGGGEYQGKRRVGTYGPAPDGTTRWLCVDFDGGGEHSAPPADPLAVALSVQALCHRVSLSAYLERSGGGKGWHLWLFFGPGIPAR
jgi:hypothetical protein